jgi:hypothetical protein
MGCIRTLQARLDERLCGSAVQHESSSRSDYSANKKTKDAD